MQGAAADADGDDGAGTRDPSSDRADGGGLRPPALRSDKRGAGADTRRAAQDQAGLLECGPSYQCCE